MLWLWSASKPTDIIPATEGIGVTDEVLGLSDGKWRSSQRKVPRTKRSRTYSPWACSTWGGCGPRNGHFILRTRRVPEWGGKASWLDNIRSPLCLIIWPSDNFTTTRTDSARGVWKRRIWRMVPAPGIERKRVERKKKMRNGKLAARQ